MTARLAFLVPIALALAAGARPAAAQDADTSSVRRVGLEARLCETRGGGRQECFDVRLRDRSSTVTADRVLAEGGGVYLFEQRVRIVDEGDTLTADRVRYDRNARFGRATGSVRLGDGEVVVLAPEGDYDTGAKRADFRAGVTLIDSVSTLSSRSGSYWTEERRAEFAGDVRLEQDSLRMAADSLLYLRGRRVAEAWSGVVIERREGAGAGVTWVLGQHAVNDEEAGRSVVRGDVLVLRVAADSTSADSLWIRSGRVDFARTDSLETIVAVDSVRIAGDDFAALADSVEYRIEAKRPDAAPARREGRFFGSPMAWFGTSQVSGDSIRVAGRDQDLDTLVVQGAARLALRDSSDAPMQQLRGHSMVGLFERDSLRTLTVSSNAEALYHLDSAERPEAGAVRTSGDRVVLRLEGGEVRDIRIYEGVEGTWYPASLVDDSISLEGVAWRPDLRPNAEPLRARYLTARCRIDAAGCRASAEPR
jgi:lipopolysaccharide export system protein LptA